MIGSPFRRAIAMMGAFTAAVAQAGQDLAGRFTAQRNVEAQFGGAYKSRGHGEGLHHNKHSARSVAQDKRDAAKRRNKGKH